MKKLNRLLGFILSLSLIAGMFISNTTVFAADTSNDFSITNGVLYKYNGSGGDIVIPNGVKKIDWNAFQDCTSLTGITIPNSVTEIGGFAFKGCTNLKKISIPNSVTKIWNYAFEDTQWVKDQTAEFIIVGKNILYKYNGAGGTITVPDGVQTIGDNSFAECKNITSVVLPNSITQIGDNAFSCSSLININIPKSITNISDGAFGYSGLTSIDIPDSVKSIGNGAFSGTKLTSIVIPNSVTSIGYSAFCSCKSLSSITIPASLTTIGRWAFDGTPWLNNFSTDYVVINGLLVKYKGTSNTINIPKGTTKINDCSFQNCSNITEINIPNSVSTIGQYAFQGCSSITDIKIPSSVSEIGQYAFQGCTGLTNVVIPEGVQYIRYAAFYNCTNLASITISKSVTVIGDDIVKNTKAIIIGYDKTEAQVYAKKYSLTFKSLGAAPSTDNSKIVYNGKEYRGSVTLDTQSYNMAPGNKYEIGVKFKGISKNMKVTSSRDSVASVSKMPNGDYLIKGLTTGTTYVICTLYNDDGSEITHASIKVTVARGVRQGGAATRSTSYYN